MGEERVGPGLQWWDNALSTHDALLSEASWESLSQEGAHPRRRGDSSLGPEGKTFLQQHFRPVSHSS